jgi:hypothetical protein
MIPEESDKEELQALVRALAWNDAFGCYTQAGFAKVVWPEIAERARWIIYFDLDDIHALNAAHGGYEAVDRMVNLGLSVLRWTDLVAAQVKSGDEFLVCMVESDSLVLDHEQRQKLDPQALKDRLSDSLKKAGLAATFAIVPVVSPDLAANLKPAIDQVFAAKSSRPAGGRR